MRAPGFSAGRKARQGKRAVHRLVPATPLSRDNSDEPCQGPNVGKVVNLNRFRKKKEREEKARQAEINRVRHGRTKAQKDQELADRQRAARLLEGKRLEGV